MLEVNFDRQEFSRSGDHKPTSEDRVAVEVAEAEDFRVPLSEGYVQRVLGEVKLHAQRRRSSNMTLTELVRGMFKNVEKGRNK